MNDSHAPKEFVQFVLKLVQKKLQSDLPEDEKKHLLELRDNLLDARKNSIKVVTVDMTDAETHDRMGQLAAFLMAMLVHACESPVEAYAACQLVQDMLGRTYNIAGIQGIRMPTEMKQ